MYDNAKVVVLDRDDKESDHEWNSRMLDSTRRVGFELRLCRPYRAQAKGKVESGVKYLKGNFWPSARFGDDADLNRRRRPGATVSPTSECMAQRGECRRLCLASSATVSGRCLSVQPWSCTFMGSVRLDGTGTSTGTNHDTECRGPGQGAWCRWE